MMRAKVPFDVKHFERKQKRGEQLTTEATFHEIYKSNHWKSKKSVSGNGSEDAQTLEIRLQIPKIVRLFNIKRFLDIPCGDFNWFGKMDLPLEWYIGGDIVTDVVNENNRRFGSSTRQFLKIDLIKDELPGADILLCRDCLVHLSNKDILRLIQNLKRSTIKYLLTTTFSACDTNDDIVTGDWRIINLEKPPFHFPKPIQLINEKCSEGDGTYSDKCLGLWKVDEL